MNFLLKQKNETNTHTSSIKKTDIENDEKLETGRGNSNRKEKLKQNLRVRKRRTY